jgi:hypothetical protein
MSDAPYLDIYKLLELIDRKMKGGKFSRILPRNFR